MKTVSEGESEPLARVCRHFNVKSTNFHIVLDQHSMEMEKTNRCCHFTFTGVVCIEISLSHLETSV